MIAKYEEGKNPFLWHIIFAENIAFNLVLKIGAACVGNGTASTYDWG